MKIPLIVCGAFGRMGREVIAMAKASDRFLLKAAVVKKRDGEDLGCPLYIDLQSALADYADAVVIDFSTAEQAAENLVAASHLSAPFLLATTGHDEQTLALAKELSQHTAIVVAPNTSLLANLLISFCSQASARLQRCETSILEIHHAAKKDCPSGTAKAMAHAITTANPNQEVEVRSMRKGTVAGEHTAYFFSDYDRLEITHRVSDRRIFAEGALVAAQFLFDCRPGLYDMSDVLNLKLTIEK